jgi:hypothetical protein
MLCFYFVLTVPFNISNVLVPCACSITWHYSWNSFHAQHHGMTIEIPPVQLPREIYYTMPLYVCKKMVDDMK